MAALANLEHGELYSEPELYELAFSYRDYPRECAFLAGLYAAVHGRAPESFLELAAGPADHALEFAARGADAAALDRAPAMVQHGLARAAKRGLALHYWPADMCAFRAPRRYALAACMLDSASYLLDDAQLDAHLHAVAEALQPGGVYALELAHPAALEPGAALTKNSWTVRGAHGALHARWDREPEADPVPGGAIGAYRAELKLERPDGREQRTESRGLQRSFRWAELQRLLRANGRFRVLRVLGALDASLALDAPGAWRMLPVLQRVD